MVEEEAARARQLEEEGAAREAHLGVLQDKASGRSRAVAVWGSRGSVLHDSSVLFFTSRLAELPLPCRAWVKSVQGESECIFFLFLA